MKIPLVGPVPRVAFVAGPEFVPPARYPSPTSRAASVAPNCVLADLETAADEEDLATAADRATQLLDILAPLAIS